VCVCVCVCVSRMFFGAGEVGRHDVVEVVSAVDSGVTATHGAM
jgi:hypothetical protein